MREAQATIGSGRVTISRRLLVMAGTLLLGTTLVPSVEATKKGKNTIESVNRRVQSQRDICETIGGGILTQEKVGKDTVTQCTGGRSHGRRCVHSKNKTECHQAFEVPPTSDSSGVGVPVSDVQTPEEPTKHPNTGVGVPVNDVGRAEEPNTSEPFLE